MTADALSIKPLIESIKPGFVAQVGLILGSGLGPLAEQLEDSTAIPFNELPGFPSATVAGHGGYLYLGYLYGVPVACLQGRVHLYEGIDYPKIKTLIRSLKVLGVKDLIITNSSGSLNADVGVGEIVALRDHINMQFNNPLVGPNDNAFGDRFVGMENAYDQTLRDSFHTVADAQGITLHNGVYVGVIGPSFETPAEINAYRVLGADVVGMSTVADVIIARHCGLRVAALAGITNLAAGMHSEQLTHDVTLAGAKIVTEKMTTLVVNWFKQYAQQSKS